jgi:3-oxoacyl-[acyl-carrier-protein] synthase II
LKTNVVITGLGLITPIGIGAPDFWNACLKGRSGVRPVPPTQNRGPSVPIAGTVLDFDPASFVSPGRPDRMDRFSHFAIAATKFALEDARLKLEQENRRKIGVILGSSIGGMLVAEEQMERLHTGGPKKVHPRLIPAYTPNAPAGEVAIKWGMKGANLSILTPYVSSAVALGIAYDAAVALGIAYDAFQLHDLDVLVAGGVDAPLIRLTSKFILRTGLVSSKAIRPFDKKRDGFVIGEGCAVLVLERLEHALERGASIYAEYGGYGQTHSASSYDIDSRMKAADLALKMALVSREDVNYIHANGTATREGDVIETRAIKALFGARAYDIPISATKSMIGHTIGAAGAIESAVCALAIRDGIIVRKGGLFKNSPFPKGG